MTVLPGQGEVFDGPAARTAADGMSAALPLPTGAAPIDLRWETMGPVATGDIQLMLQMQAACRWYALALSGADDDAATTTAIVSQVPSWSAFRGSQLSAQLQVIATGAASGDLGAMRAFVTANCGQPALQANQRTADDS